MLRRIETFFTTTIKKFLKIAQRWSISPVTEKKTLEMAEKLAPEKRHDFIHNGFSLSLLCLSIYVIVFWFHSRDLIDLCSSFLDVIGQKVFEWDQTLEEVNMYITLPPNVHPKAFHCKIQSKHIEVGIKGNPPYLNVSFFYYHSTFWILFSRSLK